MMKYSKLAQTTKGQIVIHATRVMNQQETTRKQQRNKKNQQWPIGEQEPNLAETYNKQNTRLKHNQTTSKDRKSDLRTLGS